MKRSQINALMQEADAFFQSHHTFLPPFAHWSPADWASKGPEVQEIVDNCLGWDISDYGLNDFARYGLLGFTLRNGGPQSWQRGFDKRYAERVLIPLPGQTHQMHMHARKMEDIINRGGGVLALMLYNATPDNGLAESEVRVNLDGVWRTLPAGTTVSLKPGESITLTPRLYHRFWAEGERVVMGEVSTVNDDVKDNYFYQLIGTGRFSAVEDDVPPLYPLANEYARFWKG
jgi:D-lyxose ketol-isomerase